MDSRSSLSLVSVGQSGNTGKLHIMQGVSPQTICGRSTDGATVHESEWVEEVLSLIQNQPNGGVGTSVCARCRSALNPKETVNTPNA